MSIATCRLGAVGEYFAYSKAVGARNGIIPGVVVVFRTTDSVGKHYGVSFAVGAIDAITDDLCKVAPDLINVDGVANNNKQSIFPMVFPGASA